MCERGVLALRVYDKTPRLLLCCMRTSQIMKSILVTLLFHLVILRLIHMITTIPIASNPALQYSHAWLS